VECSLPRSFRTCAAPSESDRIQLIRHDSTKIFHEYEITPLVFYERAEQRTSIGGKRQSTTKSFRQFSFQPHNPDDAAGREVDEFDEGFIRQALKKGVRTASVPLTAQGASVAVNQ
jgi:hypothetical protein